MKDYEDDFGHQLYDYLFRGGRSAHIIERSDGHIYENRQNNGAAHGLAVYFALYGDWTPYEKQAMQFVTGRVLDIGCGAGKHSLYLQEKDVNILSIDISPLALEVCRLRGLLHTRMMSITQVSSSLGTFGTRPQETVILS